jgi:hypothetical protein
VKKSWSIGLLAAVVFAAASASFYAIADFAVSTCRAARAWIGNAFFNLITGPLPADDKQPTASMRGFVVHREHRLSQVKRQAPRIEDSWRMCPSV